MTTPPVDPVRAAPSSAEAPYALATGEPAAYRLRIFHELYGPASRRVLLAAGLQRGMRVADVGCGVGMVTAWLAEQVGPEGQVVGIDESAAQLAQAREPGLITSEALESTLVEMRRATADETVLAVMPRMSQVWARKPGPHAGGQGGEGERASRRRSGYRGRAPGREGARWPGEH